MKCTHCGKPINSYTRVEIKGQFYCGKKKCKASAYTKEERRERTNKISRVNQKHDYKNNKKFREKIKNRNKQWQEDNPDKIVEYSKKRLEKFKDEFGFEHGEDIKFARMHWANIIKNRDGRCMKCGSKENLHAHHIIPVSVDISKALNEDNGITLCKECHRGDFHHNHGLDYSRFFMWLGRKNFYRFCISFLQNYQKTLTEISVSDKKYYKMMFCQKIM